MYRVSAYIRHFAWALLAGVGVATLWVNLSPASYYDFIEWRLVDLPLPALLSPFPISLTPLVLVSDGLMAIFVFFIGKELWEALVLERGALSGGRALVPMAGMFGGMLGAILVWGLTSMLFETAIEATPGIGWQVPLGSDVVLAYVFGRWIFGPGHPALHVLLLITIASDILGLLLAGLSDPASVLRLALVVLWPQPGQGRPRADPAARDAAVALCSCRGDQLFRRRRLGSAGSAWSVADPARDPAC